MAGRGLLAIVVLISSCKDSGTGQAQSGASDLSFRDMHEEAVAQTEKGLSFEAAARPFVGRPVELDVVAGERQPGICSLCFVMTYDGIEFMATPHRDLDALKFGIFVEQHEGERLHIKGMIAGSAQGFVARSPLAVEVHTISPAAHTPPDNSRRTETSAVPVTPQPQEVPAAAAQSGSAPISQGEQPPAVSSPEACDPRGVWTLFVGKAEMARVRIGGSTRALEASLVYEDGREQVSVTSVTEAADTCTLLLEQTIDEVGEAGCCDFTSYRYSLQFRPADKVVSGFAVVCDGDGDLDPITECKEGIKVSGNHAR